jgi:hypothetical protein
VGAWEVVAGWVVRGVGGAGEGGLEVREGRWEGWEVKGQY